MKIRWDTSQRGKQILFVGGKKRGRPNGSRTIKRQKSNDQKLSDITKPDSTNTPLQRSNHKDIKYGDMGCKAHNEHGQNFIVAPLDGIPFLSSFTRDASKLLHPIARLTLQQLELFTLSAELMKSEKMNGPPRSVGVRCRGCVADKNGCCFVKLSSIDGMSRELHLMVVKHLIDCRYISASDVKAIREWMEIDQKPIANFCRWIAKLYSMEDSSSGGVDSCLVWGDSPKVLPGYSCPADIDIGSLLRKPIPELDGSASSTRIVKSETQSAAKKVAEGARSVMASSPGSDSSSDGYHS